MVGYMDYEINQVQDQLKSINNVKKMQDKCDYYFASSSFDKEKMTYYPTFEQLPNRRGYGLLILKDHDRVKKIVESISWPDVSFLATNSSYNMRTSLVVEALIENGIKTN